MLLSQTVKSKPKTIAVSKTSEMLEYRERERNKTSQTRKIRKPTTKKDKKQ